MEPVKIPFHCQKKTVHFVKWKGRLWMRMEGEREIEFTNVMKQKGWYNRKRTGLEWAPPLHRCGESVLIALHFRKVGLYWCNPGCTSGPWECPDLSLSQVSLGKILDKNRSYNSSGDSNVQPGYLNRLRSLPAFILPGYSQRKSVTAVVFAFLRMLPRHLLPVIVTFWLENMFQVVLWD